MNEKDIKSASHQLFLLRTELMAMEENIMRLQQFVIDNSGEEYAPHSSLVMGELKHRSVALKQRLTVISKITTGDLFN